MKSKGFAGLAQMKAQLRDTTTPLHHDAGLEIAIEREPEDVASYLVYADALQRSGDPRGELIALQAAALERHDDTELADAIRGHLAAHELYLLGALAPDVRAGDIEVTWRLGFIHRIEAIRATTADAIALVELLAVLPSSRFLRELRIVNASARELDGTAIADRLAELGRPRTLAQLRISSLGWSISDALRLAFPQLADGERAARAAYDALATRSAGTIDWATAATLSPDQIEARLARIQPLLERPDQHGITVDPKVLSDAAQLVGGGRVGDVIVPPLAGSVFVEGDLTVDGVFDQPFRSAPVIVFGNVTCRSLCTDGYLVVTGDLVVTDVFYGASTNYGTHVFGTVRIATELLEDDHHLGAHGGLHVERTGDAALYHLTSRGLDLDSRDGIVDELRAGR